MNETIFNFFYSIAHQSSFLDTMIIFVAVYYGWVILVALFLYLVEHEDKKSGVRDLIVVLVSAGIALAVALSLKNFFHTLRPFDVFPWVHPLALEPDYAFPSGHATFFMALASTLWFYHKRLALFFGLSAVFIGIARVVMGVHWPGDILGGLFLGLLIGTTTHHLFSSLSKRQKK